MRQSAGKELNMNDDRAILSIKSPRDLVGGPYVVVHKDLAERWALVALHFEDRPTLGIRWFWGNEGTPFSRQPTWFILPEPLHDTILSKVCISVREWRLFERFLSNEITPVELIDSLDGDYPENNKADMEELFATGTTIDGEPVRLPIEDGVLRCYDSQLKELIVPNGVKEVNCHDNQLTKLVLPESVKNVDCSCNELTELIIPNGTLYVYCSYNQLTKLVLPSGVEDVNCINNQIQVLSVPKSVKTIRYDPTVKVYAVV